MDEKTQLAAILSHALGVTKAAAVGMVLRLPAAKHRPLLDAHSRHRTDVETILAAPEGAPSPEGAAE